MGEEVDPARMYADQGRARRVGRLPGRGGRAVLRRLLQAEAAAERAGPSGDERGARSGGVALHGACRTSNEEEAELWRGKVQAFRNLYGFLSQVIPYQDSDLERLYVFLRHLAAKLPRRKSGPAYQFDDEVRLEYYRLQKISEGSISLQDGDARPLDGPTEVGSGLVRDAAGAAVAADRPRERALRHGLQPGRPALLRSDRRGRDGRRRPAAGGGGESRRQVRAGVQEPAREPVRRAHGPERGDLRAVHERLCRSRRSSPPGWPSEAYRRLRGDTAGERTADGAQGRFHRTRPGSASSNRAPRSAT